MPLARSHHCAEPEYTDDDQEKEERRHEEKRTA